MPSARDLLKTPQQTKPRLRYIAWRVRFKEFGGVLDGTRHEDSITIYLQITDLEDISQKDFHWDEGGHPTPCKKVASKPCEYCESDKEADRRIHVQYSIKVIDPSDPGMPSLIDLDEHIARPLLEVALSSKGVSFIKFVAVARSAKPNGYSGKRPWFHWDLSQTCIVKRKAVPKRLESFKRGKDVPRLSESVPPVPRSNEAVPAAAAKPNIAVNSGNTHARASNAGAALSSANPVGGKDSAEATASDQRHLASTTIAGSCCGTLVVVVGPGGFSLQVNAVVQSDGNAVTFESSISGSNAKEFLSKVIGDIITDASHKFYTKHGRNPAISDSGTWRYVWFLIERREDILLVLLEAATREESLRWRLIDSIRDFRGREWPWIFCDSDMSPLFTRWALKTPLTVKEKDRDRSLGPPPRIMALFDEPRNSKVSDSAESETDA